MSELQKAHLQAIDAEGTPLGDPIPVQFNPSSLRLQIANQVEGGATRGRQVRQYTGSSSTTLTVDLIFDTADEGTTDSPVSVRERTLAVEQFLYPRGEGTQKQAPPQLRFEWGDLVLEGVVESLNIDLDHFAANGVPLRAKVGFSFKEQDRRYELRTAGDGANATGGAPSPGAATAGAVGSFSAGFSAQVGLALGGESAAEFAARLGLDAAAWRGLSFGGSVGGSLSLQAGLEVGFSAGLSASAGVGIFAGAGAGASISLEAAFGLEASLGVTAVANVGFGIELQQGFSLTAAGGLGSAIESVKVARAQVAVAQTQAAFAGSTAGNLPGGANAVAIAPPSGRPASALSSVSTPGGSPVVSGGAASARPALPSQSRTPLRLASGAPLPPAGSSPGPAAPPPPAADPRAVGFGFGVPLRATVRPAGGMGAGSLQGTVSVVSRGGGTDVPTTFDPTVPPWEALPAAVPPGRAGSTPPRRQGNPPCGCP
ncbi:MAG: hypothetical protein KF833_04305 [Verrucomicrobiae bacterium]|nr:hypothetical protein [Verrucomicrobiae bacterium]